jgi:hypothetical protein
MIIVILIWILQELEKAFLTLKINAAPGPDKISNQILVNLSDKMKNWLLNIFNKSFKEQKLPDDWKTAKIRMIEKKPNDKHNIENYRPISLTNSIGKLAEKLVKNRLVEFLEKNNKITKFQSGFKKKEELLII